MESLERLQLAVVNTDNPGALELARSSDKVLIGMGTTRGLGAGGDPELGRQAAEDDREKITAVVKDCDLVFIIAGMGGGTGGGAAPIIAEMAAEQGALVIAFVTLPFSFEGGRRLESEGGGGPRGPQARLRRRDPPAERHPPAGGSRERDGPRLFRQGGRVDRQGGQVDLVDAFKDGAHQRRLCDAQAGLPEPGSQDALRPLRGRRRERDRGGHREPEALLRSSTPRSSRGRRTASSFNITGGTRPDAPQGQRDHDGDRRAVREGLAHHHGGRDRRGHAGPGGNLRPGRQRHGGKGASRRGARAPSTSPARLAWRRPEDLAARPEPVPAPGGGVRPPGPRAGRQAAMPEEFGFGEVESRGQFERTDRNLYDGQDLDVPNLPPEKESR